MNAESRKKSRTEGLKASVFEFCSLLLQAAIPSSPVKNASGFRNLCPNAVGRLARTFLNYGP